ncbi:MAG: hypothetical protein HYY23_01835 [Verrucomicrobia bacterium]|nr:hypothetical protein [Verrucomicrobiota bacterium]
MNNPPAEQPGASLWFRLICRVARALVLLLLLLAVVFLYLNQIGLPAFAKIRIEDQLQSRGIDLQFDRLRLHGLRTCIAENVRWRKAPDLLHPELAVARAELRLRASALWRLQTQLESLIVRQGRLIVPFVSSNSPPARLPLEEIHLELRFSSDGQWDLTRFAARCKNAAVEASGTITNALTRRAAGLREPAEKRISAWPERLHRLVSSLDRITFSPASRLHFTFQGDGRDAGSLRAKLDLQLPQASGDWGTVENLRLNLDTTPGDTVSRTLEARCGLQVGAARLRKGDFTNARGTAELSLVLTNLNSSQGEWRLQLSPRTDWGGADELIVFGKAAPRAETVDQRQVGLTLEANGLRTPWGRASSALLTSDLVQAADQFVGLDGTWRLELTGLESKWAESESARFSGNVRRSPINAEQKRSDPSWGVWQKLESVFLDWESQIRKVSSAGVLVDEINSVGEWRAPELTIRKVSSQISGGRLDAEAALDISKREVRSRIAFDFDVHRIQPLLATNTQRWLRPYSWETPPRVQAEARLLLPAWTNREPGRFKETLKTVAIAGSFETAAAAYRGVPVTSARSQFNFSNSIWRLPNLVVSRPEGQIHLNGVENTATREYHWAIQSRIDPQALAPLLGPSEKRVLDYFQFAQPPFVQGHVRGQWGRPEHTGFSAEVALTNFTFRGEALDSVHAALQFTNRLLEFRDVKVRHGPGQITAPWVAYDARANLVHVTNGVSTLEPDLVARVISRPVRAAIAPYHFQEPPTVVVNGRLPTRSQADADATFKIAGQTFNWWRFNVPEISGDVHWLGESVTITNLQAAFYRGKLSWDGKFDFSGPPGARFRFRGHAIQSDLRTLVADLTLTNTPLEGTFGADLVITSADTQDWSSWQGYGDVQLRDGFLWNIPIFGFFSPVLNKIVPGLGQSRVSAGSASFTIDKSQIRTSDLEMKAPALRLQYVGAVSFKGNVNARVQAEILRDAWAVGRIVSLALWPVTKVFEYKVTGTLNEPTSELLYFPKLLVLPFRPLKILKEILPLGERTPSAPPKLKSETEANSKEP